MWQTEIGLQTRTSHNPPELRQLRTVLPGPPWREGHTKPCLSLDFIFTKCKFRLASAASPEQRCLPGPRPLCLPLPLPPSWIPSRSVALPTRLDPAANPEPGVARPTARDLSRRYQSGALSPTAPDFMQQQQQQQGPNVDEELWTEDVSMLRLHLPLESPGLGPEVGLGKRQWAQYCLHGRCHVARPAHSPSPRGQSGRFATLRR